MVNHQKNYHTHVEYQDYYKILNVPREASAEEIKKQYRHLARKYHPDVSTETNAEEKFKRIQEAYAVLKDPKKRKAYDNMGNHWQQGQGFTPPPQWEWGFQKNQEARGPSEFSDFFETLFGSLHTQGRTRREFVQKGEDLQAKLVITLEEAFHGVSKVLELPETILDPATGQYTRRTRTIRVNVPAGVVPGQNMRLSGQGAPGVGNAPPGDLYLEVHLRTHPVFTLKNKDILLNLPVTPWEAALGAKIMIPTLGGPVALSLPPNSQTGKQLRLKGRGLPGNPSGDQYVTLVIHTPPAITPQEKNLYETMAKEMSFNPRKALLAEG